MSGLLSYYDGSKLYYAQLPTHIYRKAAKISFAALSSLKFRWLSKLSGRSMPQSRYEASLTGVKYETSFDSKTPLAIRPRLWPKADRSILRHHERLVSLQSHQTQVEIAL